MHHAPFLDSFMHFPGTVLVTQHTHIHSVQQIETRIIRGLIPGIVSSQTNVTAIGNIQGTNVGNEMCK